ncbi:hypothetical protein T11_15616 [Trichinella zimbabwensis]|uniref:Uncharacterized protein n=1 Tax=Trichinella zimbabwensis TaxID=268475 RepID=A0A0V1HI79_9BILA|nr:hypothetical protein T11_15616 [Trichinella zimbabwensis]
MDEKWRKNELPKLKKYCTWTRSFNEYFTKMLRMHCATLEPNYSISTGLFEVKLCNTF